MNTFFQMTFVPIVKWVTIWMILALAFHQGWLIKQLNVCFAFLNGELLNEVFMIQPKGFEVLVREHQICRLINTIYGLCQTSRA
jgi:hypothetical protein